MNDLITTDTILNALKERVENKVPVSPNMWIDAAEKLNILLGDEHDLLLDLQQKVAQMRADLIEGGDSVAKAKSKIEATDEHKEANRQRAKISRIEEMIRIAKIQARLKESEMRGY